MESLPLRYAKTNKYFNAGLQMRRSLVPPSGVVKLTRAKLADGVFVKAASSNHFVESIDMVICSSFNPKYYVDDVR